MLHKTEVLLLVAELRYDRQLVLAGGGREVGMTVEGETSAFSTQIADAETCACADSTMRATGVAAAQPWRHPGTPAAVDQAFLRPVDPARLAHPECFPLNGR